MPTLSQMLGNTDIYLIDQLLQQRYQPGQRLLDAGCGEGRNLHWLVQQPDLHCFACDASAEALQVLQRQYPLLPPEHIAHTTLEQLPYPSQYFHHVICSAVLHFANSEPHFWAMMKQLCRVLLPGGSLFIRMAAIMGIETKVIPLGNGRYHLPDNTDRFLLTPTLLHDLTCHLPLQLAMPQKTTNVANLRCMSTLIFIKQ